MRWRICSALSRNPNGKPLSSPSFLEDKDLIPDLSTLPPPNVGITIETTCMLVCLNSLPFYSTCILLISVFSFCWWSVCFRIRVARH
jgi:hypothetical protein